MEYNFTHQEYLSDFQVMDLYDQMVSEGLYDKVFYADQHPTAELFLDYIRAFCWMASVRDEEDESVGVFWLDGFSGKVAFLHYWVFKIGWGQAKRLPQAVVQWITDNTDGCITGLLGKTPSSNRLALRYLGRAGFAQMFEIEDAVRFKDGSYGSAVISYRRLK